MVWTQPGPEPRSGHGTGPRQRTLLGGPQARTPGIRFDSKLCANPLARSLGTASRSHRPTPSVLEYANVASRRRAGPIVP